MKAHTSFRKWLKIGGMAAWCLGLSACSTLGGSDSGPTGKFNASNIPDAVPTAEPRSKYGNPASYVVAGKRYYVMKDAKGYDKVGDASWYGTKFHGQHTSSRESYNMYSMTAASPTLPIPTYVRVTNLQNGCSAIVKVNDRGPFRSSRIIDLSYAAAQKLGYANKGTARVRVTALDATAPGPLLAQNNSSLLQSRAGKTIGQAALSKSANEVAAALPTQLAQRDARSSYLQVGAFHNRRSAENVSKQISDLTKMDHVQVAIKEATGNGNGGSLYRVHIGPLQDADRSKQLAQLLAKYGFDKAMVVSG